MLIRASDNWHLGCCIGTSFLLRSLIFTFGFPMLKAPDTIWTFVMVLGMISTTGSQSVTVDSFFSKLVPSDISGTMRGLYNFFGQLGLLTMTLISGYLYDTFGPSSPFVVIGVLDGLLSLVTFTLCFHGSLNPNKKTWNICEIFDTTEQGGCQQQRIHISIWSNLNFISN